MRTDQMIPGDAASHAGRGTFRFQELPGLISLLVIGEGVPLVVFPGLSRDSRQLTARIAARQAAGYRGLAHATGRSVHVLYRPRDLFPAVTMPELAGAHARALRELFSEPIDVMGVSTGGAIALQLAVDYPLAVRHLIVAGAAGSLGESGRRRLEEYGRLISQGKSGARLLATVLAGPMLRWPATVMIWLEEWLERHLDPSDMLATIHAECGFDVYPRLAEITAPTLVIAGEDDRVLARTVSHDGRWYSQRQARALQKPWTRNGHVRSTLWSRCGGISQGLTIVARWPAASMTGCCSQFIDLRIPPSGTEKYPR